MSELFKPFPYQETMRAWADERPSFGYLASPGLGKTAVSLQVLESRMLEGQTRGAVVICPVRVASVTWPNQIAKWQHSSWMKIAHLRTPEGLRTWLKGNADVYLINPEQLPKMVPLMFPKKFTPPVDTVIIDELSLAKNPTSVRFNALRPHLPKFSERVGLTGTPVPNNYLDLFAQIRLLDDGQRLGRSFSQYKQQYFTSDFMGYKWTINPGAKEAIDAKIADLCLVMLGDDYLDLPTCNTEDIAISLPPVAKAAYKELEKELLLELEKSDVVALNAATLSNKLLQLTGGSIYGEEKIVNHVHTAKTDALKKLRKTHKKEPMLVLCAFKHESARVLESIPGAVMFHEDLIPDWKRGKIHTMVADPRSLSHGIDGLQEGGRIAVWFTLTWSNETYLQTNARLVRMGQSCETLIYRLIVSGTIDDAVSESLKEKSDTQSGLMKALKALQMLKAG